MDAVGHVEEGHRHGTRLGCAGFGDGWRRRHRLEPGERDRRSKTPKNRPPRDGLRTHRGFSPSPRCFWNGSLLTTSSTSRLNRYWSLASAFTIRSTAESSASFRPRPMAYVSIFRARQRANSRSRRLRIPFSAFAPWNVSPEGSFPEESIGNVPSRSRHAPTASNFSSRNPSGSSRLWHEAQFGLARCCSIRCRSVPESTAFLSSFKFGTSGGGGGGGVPRICSRIHLPRFTGDVRVGFDVIVRMLACVSSPPRRSPCRETRRKRYPLAFGMP